MSDDTGPIPVLDQGGNGDAAWSGRPMPPMPPLPPVTYPAGTDAAVSWEMSEDGEEPQEAADGPPSLPAELETMLAESDRRDEGRRPQRGWTPARRFTIALVAALLVMAGFVGGIAAQKSFGSTSASAAPSGFGAGQAPPGGATAGGQGQGQPQGQGQGQGDVTAGTVKMVDAGTVYVTTASGATVKVATTDSSRVVKMSVGTAGDITPGDSIVVQGNAGADGTVAATSVTVGAPGVSPFGGAGGGRRGGSASGGSAPSPPG